MTYRGRLAPSPTGYLHIGHARTFWIAQQRAIAHGGALILRNDDLDTARCKPEFIAAMIEDMRWLGLRWSEGPDIGGPHAPYDQSARMPHYTAAFEQLRARGVIYPCTCSRQDVLRALTAPHEGEDEPVYPGTCRGTSPDRPRAGVNWRFRVPDEAQGAGVPPPRPKNRGEGAPAPCRSTAPRAAVEFIDGHFGSQRAEFGDFLVWRKDDFPSYQLACTVDDAAMRITEVVRGADLIASTARQLLLYRALGLEIPAFHHCPLVTDASGIRLAKRDDARSLRTLRAQGRSPEELRREWDGHLPPSS